MKRTATTAQEPQMTFKHSQQVFRSFMNNAKSGMNSDEAREATMAEFSLSADDFQKAFRLAYAMAR